MSDFEDRKKDVAGLFVQAGRERGLDVLRRLLPLPPEKIEEIIEEVKRKDEDEGMSIEGIEIVRRWIRNEADAEWLEAFWQSPQGGRLLDLVHELQHRATFKIHYPEVPLKPPGQI